VWLPGSARSDRFAAAITPWTREVLEAAANPLTRVVTFVKPVQSGGSVVGEVMICYWLTHGNAGDCQYNWETDDKAKMRWDRRVKRILRSCDAVQGLWPTDRFAASSRGVAFPHMNLIVQGAHNPANLDSDSIRYQVNEEVHNWEPGRLEKAYKRTTAYWDAKIVNISNASQVRDQLWESWDAGTKRRWEVRCPGCGEYHAMRTKWEEDKPELGGLRYDSSGCKREDGTYDYLKLAGTIRYQMPCGFEVRDLPRARRELSLSGRYSPPEGEAGGGSESFNLDGVAVDYIPWIDLIREKHTAIRMLKYGEAEAFKRYVQERECRFWDDDERPNQVKLTLRTRQETTTDGMPDRALRTVGIDVQAGFLRIGEPPHLWAVVRDWDSSGNSMLVWEGQLFNDEELAAMLEKQKPDFGLIDSRFDTDRVYGLCLKHQLNPLRTESRAQGFRHPDGIRRMWGLSDPIMFEDPDTKDRIAMRMVMHDPQWIREKWHRLRSEKSMVKWETPMNVSEEYIRHLNSEELRELKVARTGARSITLTRRSASAGTICWCASCIAFWAQLSKGC